MKEWVWFATVALIGLWVSVASAPTRNENDATEKPDKAQTAERRGRAFVAVETLNLVETRTDERLFETPEIAAGVAADEIVVSWNLDGRPDIGIQIEARVWLRDRWTKYYHLGSWSQDGVTYPRSSVNGQKDSDGDVATDTLVLKRPAEKIQLRVTLRGAVQENWKPKFLGVSFAETKAKPAPLPSNKSVWGKELAVPGKWQSGWPGASGWCSPTSTAMALAFWSKERNRPELDIPVPQAARAIFDRVYDGTGNWPFNTAFAGSFPGMRAYVTRLSDIRQLEDWIAAGIPPVVSCSYDLLKGMKRDRDPGHLLVCNGFTQNGDIVLNDPAYHPERGEVSRRVFPRANFLRAWARSKNTVYLIYPTDAKTPADPYGHWAK
jgi:hypothetical protein